MKTILVTGGCGFIGSNFIAHVLKKKPRPQIRVFDNESSGTHDHIGDLDVEFIHGDIRDSEALYAALDGVGVVLHLAADTRVIESIENPRHNFECNVIGTYNLLEQIRRHGVETLVSASTGGAIIGDATPPVHEEMVAKPVSPYGASKLAAEGYMSAFSAVYGITATSLRFSNVYGPRSLHKGSVVAHFFKRILAGQPLEVFGDGSHTRDYVFVSDLCEGIWHTMQKGKSGVFQLGSGRPTSINELIQAIRKTVDSNHPFSVEYNAPRKGEIHRTWCDISKARNELEFETPTSLEDGLKRTWEWFQLNRAQNS